jgi:DNA-binding transcriptional ArsR family regulator
MPLDPHRTDRHATGGERVPLRRFSVRCIVTQVAVSTVVAVDVLERVGIALADGSRRRLLVALLDGPAYPSQLAAAFGLSRANVSNHLACLRGCGLVVAQPEGRQVRYDVADRRLAQALRQLLDVVLESDPGLCPAADEDGCC